MLGLFELGLVFPVCLRLVWGIFLGWEVFDFGCLDKPRVSNKSFIIDIF